MPEYIEREALIEKISSISVTVMGVRSGKTLFNEALKSYREAVLKNIKEAPTADVVEVRHGEWLLKSRIYKMPDDFDEEFYVECPFCQRTFYVPFEFEKEKMLAYAKENYPYCNCGAKMDGKGD